MKRGIRRLTVVVAVLVGIFVTYHSLETMQKGFSGCVQFANEEPTRAGCFGANRPDWAACLKEAEVTRKQLIESCNQTYNTRNTLVWPVAIGGLAFLGVALLLEFIRFIVAWVVSGFRS